MRKILDKVLNKFAFVFLSLFTVFNTNNNGTIQEIIDNMNSDNYDVDVLYIISTYLFMYSLLLFGGTLSTKQHFNNNVATVEIISVTVASLALFHCIMCIVSLLRYRDKSNSNTKKHYVLLYCLNIVFSLSLFICALYKLMT